MTSLKDLSLRMQSKEIRKSRLVLSAPHSVAETWLPRKLAPLIQLDDYSPVDVRIDDDPVDFVRDKIDVRIFFGHDLYRDYQTATLFTESLIAVASPDFMRRFGPSLQDLPDRYLIHTDWGSGFVSSPNWETFLPFWQINQSQSRNDG